MVTSSEELWPTDRYVYKNFEPFTNGNDDIINKKKGKSVFDDCVVNVPTPLGNTDHKNVNIFAQHEALMKQKKCEDAVHPKKQKWFFEPSV